MSSLSLGAVALALLASTATAGVDEERPFDLLVGDPAPALDVKEWVQGEPVRSFAAGQVYVVEFWATWCGPCRRAIPHVNQLQNEYGDKVRFVGVSIWENDHDLVKPFVEKMGEDMQYTVGADVVKDGAMARTWMHAAGERGIPAAFIVDGTGKVAWIGHPMSIDEPLAQVVAGEWDLAAAAKSHRAAKMTEMRQARAREAVAAAREAGDHEAMLRAIDEAVAQFPELGNQFAMDRFYALLHGGHAEKSSAYGRELVDGVFSKSAGALNAIAWMIVDPDAELKHRDVELALLAGEKACELTEWENPAVLDTFAMALFRAGRLDEAIEYQEKAVKLAAGSEMEADLRKRLEKFREATGV